MSSTHIPTTVLGPSSRIPARPSVEEVVLGPASPLTDRRPAGRVHHLTDRPSRPAGAPAYFLGRSAVVWLGVLGLRAPRAA
jgi:hypothetical protein